jgi:2-amino-4-hydroxy-6-hydroxymethyldihydropteridine diphosphokinase
MVYTLVLKNAAKLHFLFHSTKYLSRNSRILPFFFHFVKSTSHFLLSFDSFLYIIIFIIAAKLLNIFQSLFCSIDFFAIFAFVMPHKERHIIISLASNINQEAHLEAARTQLIQLLTDVHFTRAIFTDPIGTLRQEPYLNQLCSGTTALGMNLLNEVLKEIEKRLGRTHNEDGIVTLDLDLLEYDGERFHLRDWNRNYVKDLINEL